MSFRLRICLLGACALGIVLSPRHAAAQDSEKVMTEAEVEKLRESAYVPNDRVAVFIKILDSRAKAVDDLLAKRRKPGREQDLHDIFEQVSEIADELNDNLEDYEPKHRDLRKTLPKLIEATERWSTSLRAAVEDPSYKVSRKLALDAVRDVQEAAKKMQTDEIAYFKEHPEAAKADLARTSNEPDAPKPICIPR